jgi:prepilin-type N-terminal cleavage/methylation domain-containing protein
LTATSPSIVVPVRRRRGFTLVELLAVIAIIGVLIGMLLPAVQRARESGRQTTCINNLKNMAVALCSYESSRKTFPPSANVIPVGSTLPNGTRHAWSSYILPYIEEVELANRIDYSKVWNAPGKNATAAMQNIQLYTCPSGMVPFLGKQDYAGISGSTIMLTGTSLPPADGLFNGVLIPITADHPRPVKAADITDGLSATVLVGESVDRGLSEAPGVSLDENARWANGTNSFSQSERFVNERSNQNMRSNHPVGCHAAFVDGRVMFLADNMDPTILSAICTRNGGEHAASLVNRQ